MPTRFAKCRKLRQLARREFPVAAGSRQLEDSTAIICFGLTRLHVCPRLRSLMRVRRTIACTSRRDSPVLRRRTVWVRNSSKAKRLPFRLPLMGRLPWARRVRAARRWYCGRPCLQQRRRGAIDALSHGLSLGVTTHLDQGAFQPTNTPSDGAAHEDNYTMHMPFLALHQEGKLPARLRINFLHQDTTADLPTLTERLRNSYKFFGDDVVRTGGIGEFIGGGTGANNNIFVEAAKRIARAGWRAEVHSLSATDFQQEIQNYEAAHAEFPITDLRWVIAHVPFITEPWVNRLKAMGGGLSLTSWRYLAGTPEQNGPPFRMIVDNGIHVGMSSDGMQIAPMNPWLHMNYATTGLNARQVPINRGQQISRQEVLKLYTANNGWFMREGDQIGTIEPGKLADLAVLSDDYFTVPDEMLKKIRSALTVVDGKVVHNAGLL